MRRQLAWPEFREVSRFRPKYSRSGRKERRKETLAGRFALPSFCADSRRRRAACCRSPRLLPIVLPAPAIMLRCFPAHGGRSADVSKGENDGAWLALLHE